MDENPYSTDNPLDSATFRYINENDKYFANIDDQNENGVEYYQRYQDKLLLMTKRSSSICLKKTYLRSNFDIMELEKIKPGTTEKVITNAVKNIPETLNEQNDRGYEQNILLDSIKNDEADKLRSKLTKLSRELKLIENETGQQIGYLGLVFLEGHIDKENYIRGPLVLFPISLKYHRRAKNGGWILKFLDSRPIINKALFATLMKVGEYEIKNNYGEMFEDLLEEMDIKDLDNHSEYFFQKIKKWFESLVHINNNLIKLNVTQLELLDRKHIEMMDEQQLHLANYVIIGKFPQGDSDIYNDYNMFINDLSKTNIREFSDVFDTVSNGIQDEGNDEEIDLDSTEDKEINLILPSDPSQDRAILESKRSNMIVVRGPPGTGKSQLIVNMIGDALSNNQRVLVVCQKRAALEVIQQRLEKVDLGKIVTFLQKESDDRRQIYKLWNKVIVEAIETESKLDKNLNEISYDIDKCVKKLSEFGKALRTKYKGINGSKLYELTEQNYRPSIDIGIVELIEDHKTCKKYLDQISKIENDFKKFELNEHPWAGRKSFKGMGIREQGELKDHIQELIAIFPKCIITSSHEEQEKLFKYIENYIINIEKLNHERIKLIPIINSMIDIKINYQLMVNNYEQINNGIKFWSLFKGIDTFITNEKKSELMNACQNEDILIDKFGTICNFIDKLLKLIPTCVLSEDAIKQNKLNEHVQNFLYNSGMLGIKKRGLMRNIRELLNNNITNEFIKINEKDISSGIKFWEIFEQLSKFINEQKMIELRSIIQNPNELKKSFRDMHYKIINILQIRKDCILAHDSDEQVKLLEHIKNYNSNDKQKTINILKNNLENVMKSHNLEKGVLHIDNYTKTRIRLWREFEKLIEISDNEECDKLLNNMNKPDFIKSILNDVLNSQLGSTNLNDSHVHQYENIKEQFQIYNNANDELIQYSNQIKLGIDFWKHFNKLLEFFEQNKQIEIKSWHNNNELMMSYLNDLSRALNEFDSIQEYDKRKNDLSDDILRILEFAKQNFDNGENWTNKLKNEIYSSWIDHFEQSNSILQGDPILTRDELTVELKNLMKQKFNITKLTIKNNINYKIKNKHQKMLNDEFIKRINAKRKLWPLKKMLEIFHEYVSIITPCWLASPEAVSRTFPMKKNIFDLVIVDEASQLATERALPFLYRAKRAVIAGDENQLPPFDLFRIHQDDEDDDDDYIRTERSLLEVVKDKHYKSFNLSWHYRSNYQDLIDFSNHAFYDGTLNIVPNIMIKPVEPPIQWIKCDGRWNNNENLIESERVIDELYTIWKNKSEQEKLPSIGVITFNARQQELIRDRIEFRCKYDSKFLELYTRVENESNKDTSLFIKNIENVQGDERDIIIFSIGYAKNDEGNFVNRFGMINKEKGENILNVAITRAKDKMIVVSSIEPTEIKQTSKNIGPKLFRQFLAYAKKTSEQDKEGQKFILNELNPDMKITSTKAVFDSEFEEQVYNKLKDKNYEVHTQIGESGYKIDLAIVHPHKNDRYVLGIECDGATFHSAKSVKERDVLRQSFLEDRGWKIERVWSRSWWRDQNKEINKIVECIEKIMENDKYNDTND